MNAVEIVAFIGVLAILAATVVLSERYSRREHERFRRFTLALNAMLAQVGRATGLRYVDHGEVTHPIIGTSPTFAALKGRMQGRELYVSVETRGDSELLIVYLRIEVWPAELSHFASLRSPPPAVTTLRAAGARTKIELGRLCVRLECKRWSDRGLCIDADELRRLLDNAVTAARALERPGLAGTK